MEPSALGAGDVTITVSQATTPTASAGTDGDFTLSLSATNNTGAPINDTGTLTLDLPSGVTPSSGCSGSGPYDCPITIVLDANGTAPVTGIQLHAAPSSAGNHTGLTGSGTIDGGGTIDVPDYSITVNAQADLGVALTGVPVGDVVAGGSGFTATASVTNYGPSDSGADWSATVTLPSADLAFGAAPSGCSVDGLIATCDGSNLAPNGSTSFDLPVSAPHDAATGAEQISAAVVPGAVSQGSDTNSDADQATAHVVAQADLGIAWSGLPTTDQVAGQDSFTAVATVTNSGPSDSGSGWSAKLTLPTGFAFNSPPTGCTLSVANTVATCSGRTWIRPRPRPIIGTSRRPSTCCTTRRSGTTAWRRR